MSQGIVKENSQAHLQKGDNKILTAREIIILAMMATGATNEQIADELCVSLHTIKNHRHNIFKKINAPNRLQAVLWAACNL